MFSLDLSAIIEVINCLQNEGHLVRFHEDVKVLKKPPLGIIMKYILRVRTYMICIHLETFLGGLHALFAQRFSRVQLILSRLSTIMEKNPT